MVPERLTVDETPWAVGVLQRRRQGILPHAPVFWHPAADAARIHEEFLSSLLTDGGAEAWRTDESVLVAARARRGGWDVDDAAAADERWEGGDGQLLWEALRGAHEGEAVRFTCPAYEEERNRFALAEGLELATTWWLREIPEPAGDPPEHGDEPEVPGSGAAFAGAPRVYAPGGPMLMLHHVEEPEAIGRGWDLARRRGCAGLVVDAPPGGRLTAALRDTGLRPHCHVYEGRL